MATNAKKTSSHTKTGRTLLGPLNIKQLEDMVSKSSKPKERDKINRRIKELQSRPGYVKPKEEVAE